MDAKKIMLLGTYEGFVEGLVLEGRVKRSEVDAMLARAEDGYHELEKALKNLEVITVMGGQNGKGPGLSNV